MLRGDAPLKNEMHLFFTFLMLFSHLNTVFLLHKCPHDIRARVRVGS